MATEAVTAEATIAATEEMTPEATATEEAVGAATEEMTPEATEAPTDVATAETTAEAATEEMTPETTATAQPEALPESGGDLSGGSLTLIVVSGMLMMLATGAYVTRRREA